MNAFVAIIGDTTPRHFITDAANKMWVEFTGARVDGVQFLNEMGASPEGTVYAVGVVPGLKIVSIPRDFFQGVRSITNCQEWMMMSHQLTLPTEGARNLLALFPEGKAMLAAAAAVERLFMPRAVLPNWDTYVEAGYTGNLETMMMRPDIQILTYTLRHVSPSTATRPHMLEVWIEGTNHTDRKLVDIITSQVEVGYQLAYKDVTLVVVTSRKQVKDGVIITVAVESHYRLKFVHKKVEDHGVYVREPLQVPGYNQPYTASTLVINKEDIPTTHIAEWSPRDQRLTTLTPEMFKQYANKRYDKHTGEYTLTGKQGYMFVVIPCNHDGDWLPEVYSVPSLFAYLYAKHNIASMDAVYTMLKEVRGLKERFATVKMFTDSLPAQITSVSDMMVCKHRKGGYNSYRVQVDDQSTMVTKALEPGQHIRLGDKIIGLVIANGYIPGSIHPFNIKIAWCVPEVTVKGLTPN